MEWKTLGQGEPLVMVPGGLTGWLNWDPFLPELSPDYQLYVVQLLNVAYGLENKPLPTNYSLAYESASLSQSVKEMGFDNAHFVAWSYGAAITLDFALNNPEKIKSLTLIEPPAIWILRNLGLLKDVLDAEEKAMSGLTTDDISEEQLVWFTHFAGFVPTEVDPRTLPPWSQWFRHRQSLRNNIVVFEHQDQIERLKNFTPLTLLVSGFGTSEFLAEIIKQLGEILPHSESVSFPGGHAPHIASRTEFLSAFKKFLKSVSG